MRSQAVKTGRKVAQGELVNFVQTFQAKQRLKGSPCQRMQVVTTGIEPLPAPSEKEANERYPGAWASGQDYLLFLKKLDGRDSYAILGLLQGVYPIQAGRTVKLENKGFAELHQVPEARLPSVVDGLLGS